MQNVNALLTEEQYEQLRDVAHVARRSMSDILREALDAWFRRRKEEGNRDGN